MKVRRGYECTRVSVRWTLYFYLDHSKNMKSTSHVLVNTRSLSHLSSPPSLSTLTTPSHWFSLRRVESVKKTVLMEDEYVDNVLDNGGSPTAP